MQLLTLLALLPTLTLALTLPNPITSAPHPYNPLTARQSCAESCGSTCYSNSNINAALNQGCSDLNNGNTPGGYPHQYNDYEGFSFPDGGPWYEFPILSSHKVYTGGSPGADRVVFTDSCEFEALITHTGASGNNFVECN